MYTSNKCWPIAATKQLMIFRVSDLCNSGSVFQSDQLLDLIVRALDRDWARRLWSSVALLAV
ncbi:hypothetical protein ACTXT7_005543 [Hymenolepis weldensis]